jgi:predicted XRE-type DNA-binding protein
MGLADSKECLLKSRLLMVIRQLATDRGLTQTRIAQIVGTDQPTVSKAFRGHLDIVSVERLVQWLNRLGQDVEVRVSPRDEGEGETRVAMG